MSQERFVVLTATAPDAAAKTAELNALLADGYQIVDQSSIAPGSVLFRLLPAPSLEVEEAGGAAPLADHALAIKEDQGPASTPSKSLGVFPVAGVLTSRKMVLLATGLASLVRLFVVLLRATNPYHYSPDALPATSFFLDLVLLGLLGVLWAMLVPSMRATLPDPGPREQGEDKMWGWLLGLASVSLVVTVFGLVEVGEPHRQEGWVFPLLGLSIFHAYVFFTMWRRCASVGELEEPAAKGSGYRVVIGLRDVLRRPLAPHGRWLRVFVVLGLVKAVLAKTGVAFYRGGPAFWTEIGMLTACAVAGMLLHRSGRLFVPQNEEEAPKPMQAGLATTAWLLMLVACGMMLWRDSTLYDSVNSDNVILPLQDEYLRQWFTVGVMFFQVNLFVLTPIALWRWIASLREARRLRLVASVRQARGVQSGYEDQKAEGASFAIPDDSRDYPEASASAVFEIESATDEPASSGEPFWLKKTFLLRSTLLLALLVGGYFSVQAVRSQIAQKGEAATQLAEMKRLVDGGRITAAQRRAWWITMHHAGSPEADTAAQYLGPTPTPLSAEEVALMEEEAATTASAPEPTHAGRANASSANSDAPLKPSAPAENPEPERTFEMPLLTKTVEILGQPREHMFDVLGEPTTVSGFGNTAICEYVYRFAAGNTHTLRAMCGPPTVRVATLELAFPSESVAREMQQRIEEMFRARWGTPRSDGSGTKWDIGGISLTVTSSADPAAFLLFFAVQ